MTGGAGALSADRIVEDVETLARPPFSAAETCVRRHAYLPELRRTVDWVAERLSDLGFAVDDGPLGTLVARNVAAGAPSIGVGSHLDSVRNGGAWDGTLGVLMALELARLDRELGLGLPLTIIAWLEEEGAGFGQLLLGSRLAAGEIGELDLRDRLVSIDTGASFWDEAVAAGYDPASWRECARALDGLRAWIEPHIEQGRVLQDRRRAVGVVSRIAGYVHADLQLVGRADHGGATPMDSRRDALAGAAEVVLAVERAGRESGDTTATVGELEVDPGILNVIPGCVRLTLDVRSGADELRDAAFTRAVATAREVCERRELTVEVRERQRLGAVQLDARVADSLARAADAARVPWMRIDSGAAHDTASIAPLVPSGMLFVPCRDGVSHDPAETAEGPHVAAALEVLVGAVAELALSCT